MSARTAWVHVSWAHEVRVRVRSAYGSEGKAVCPVARPFGVDEVRIGVVYRGAEHDHGEGREECPDQTQRGFGEPPVVLLGGAALDIHGEHDGRGAIKRDRSDRCRR